ncbi:response regulator [Bradyrhizobium sp. CCBAU 45384]|uniref:response regulator n=1 Tax=Bradyrhizobium sp. CCBAU 45384 TaxID=858428 RepID=UPI002306050A|nr:response regulator [Bradyrhizobium sp. CCBAU 45384]
MVDYRKIFESSPALFLALGADDTFPILGASDAYLRATHTERDAIIGRPLFEVFPDNPDDPSATGILNLRSSLMRVLAGGRADTMAVQRYDVRGPDGSFEKRYWSPLNSPVIGPDGRLQYIMHRVEDVTDITRGDRAAAHADEAMRLEVMLRAQELQEANRQLREATEQFQAVYDQGLFAARLRLDGTVLDINRSALEVCGFKREDVLDRPFWECGWWNGSREVMAWVRRAVEQAIAGEPFRGESLYFWGDGSEHIVDFACMPVRDASGRVVVVVPTGMDVTERVRAEQNLRELEAERRRAEALAEIDRSKTQFFSNISHEFRTPLTLMLGSLEEMKRESAGTEIPAAYLGQIDLVHRNGLRLLKLVNTLLDFSRIEAERVQAVYEPTDLAEMTAHLASEFRSAIEKAGLALVVDCPPLPDAAFVDREMWEKIILNLLSNAFKFTFEGTIKVTLHQADGQFELVVADTGTGIPTGELPRLFERFHRVEGAKGRTYEGSGIGLALVQELARLHGGDVTAESKLGAGSTFRVKIPTGSAHLPPGQIGGVRTQASTGLSARPFVEEALRWLPDASPVPDEIIDVALPVERTPAPQAQRPLVLLADDNADMREYLTRILGEHYRVEAVADGKAALEAISRRLPDLLLSDAMMPRIDGMELLTRLRADARTRSLPVILLSARAGEQTKVEALGAGADDYIVKPFTARELLARVDAHLKIASVRGEAMESLRQSEERYRAFVTATSDIVYRMSPDWSEMRDLQGKGSVRDTESPSRTWLETYVHPEDRTQVLSSIDEAIRTKTPFDFEHQVKQIDGTSRWVHSRAVPVFDRDGEIVEWFGSARDVSERRRHDETQRLLIGELSHRVKNMLAVVQAIAQQTLRRAKDPAEFAASFGGRIQSLSSMHGLLSQSGWQHAELLDILRDQLAAHEASRVVVAGPPVQLEPQVALHVALMLHELGTNSVKYGALSKAEGGVNVVWSVNDGKLRLEWRERGGPPVKSPLKRGFGTTLIEQTAKSEGGSSHVFVEAEGLRWEITLPLNTEKSIGAAERDRSTPSSTERSRTIRQAAPPEPLKGKRFLIVEDEPLIALDIVAGLEGVGVNVEGPIGSVKNALRAVEESSFDGVLLDANLRGEPVDEVAAALIRRNIPFAFVTGYGRQALPESFARATVLTKPFTQEQLLRTVSQLVGSDRTGLHLLHDRDRRG